VAPVVLPANESTPTAFGVTLWESVMAIGINAVRPSRVPSTTERALDLRHVFPVEVKRMRDGGSIEVDAPINRSMNARFFFDQGFSSPTRGEVFVQTQSFPNPGWSERRPLSASEKAELGEAMDRFLGGTLPADVTPYDVELYMAFRAGLGGPDAGVVPANLE
jgi:hypothetical protein